jgi:RNA-splicing ligase RtcB
MKNHKYEVIVGNIGTVYSGNDGDEAQRIHDVYVEQSQGGYGRASGETVTIMRNGDIYLETEA